MADQPVDSSGMGRHRFFLYALLFICTSIPLFARIEVPNKPADNVIDLYIFLEKADRNKPMLVQSDWTKSTRGESGGAFEALIRILMHHEQKFVLYSVADVQAPQVARDVIKRINDERVAAGKRKYEKWNDWVDLGYFPNGEGTANAMATNLKQAFAGRKDVATDGKQRDIFESPVLSKVQKVSDVAGLVNIHASGTIKILVERLYGKLPLASLCTGVMGPETNVYYSSKQLVGLSVGLKGVYDVETLMNKGINSGKGSVEYLKDASVVIPPMEGKTYDRGGAYYPTLHVALTLLILAVIAGNVGDYRKKKAAKKTDK